MCVSTQHTHEQSISSHLISHPNSCPLVLSIPSAQQQRRRNTTFNLSNQINRIEWTYNSARNSYLIRYTFTMTALFLLAGL